jgi:ATP-dependent Clp protease protease subunit
MMQYIKPDVATICTGMAASMQYCCVQELKENVRHCHIQEYDSPTIRRSTSVATDMEINLREMLKLKMNYTTSFHTTLDKLLTKCTDSERDYWMKA